MNRGIARRTIFENRRDARFFLALVAHTVRCGDIEVHAFCLMTTHYHLLLRSLTARMAAAMQWIQDIYSRWFNRRRRRDGPLFRGRYVSKLVRDLQHRTVVFHYIHRNPLDAGLVARARDYPYASARHYVSDASPPWLARSFGDQLGEQAANPPRLGPRARELANRWVDGQGRPRDLDDLVGAAPRRVQEWMMRKQALADGPAPPPAPLVHPATVRELIASRRVEAPKATVRLSRRTQGQWTLLEAGALRQWAALTMREIAHAQGTSTSTASQRVRSHARALDECVPYQESAAALLADAIEADHQA